MSTKIATPVVKNKFWVVEESGNKVATIQARDNGGIVYVQEHEREFFPSIKNLKQKYQIKFDGFKKLKIKIDKTVYGYPISGKSFNEVYDVQNRIPMYTKTAKSKSRYCAGYYVVNINGKWTTCFCPKSITLIRYKFLGPYKNEQDQEINYLKALDHA